MLSHADFVSVGRRAFANRRELVAVFLPASVTAIKSDAFVGCRSLRSVTLPSEGGVGIGAGAFRDCHSLCEVIGGENMTAVQEEAFRGCRSLPAVPFASDVKHIGARAFSGCTGIRTLTLSPSLRALGKAAFENCSALEEVEILSPQGVAPYAFRGCRTLRSLTLPQELSVLPVGMLSECTQLSNLELPAGLKKIGKKAFYQAMSLKKLTLPLGVTSIGAHAFDKSGIREIEIPRTVRHLGYGAFGLGKREEKTVLYAENEYTCRKLRRLLRLCGSAGCAVVERTGKTLEERRRERRRTSLEETPVHLFQKDEPKE